MSVSCCRHSPSRVARLADGSVASSSSSEGSLDIGACCLCHCSLDFSDKAAFDKEDRHSDYNSDSDEEDYFFRPNDPYLPASLYDENNALVYCDGCDRMYHQKCHFVPVLFIPRGSWKCLVCQSQQRDELIFQSPPDPHAQPQEQAWERQSQTLKKQAWNEQLTKCSKAIKHQYSNVRQATMTLDTLTSTRANRELFDHKSQQLAESILQQYTARYQCRQILINLHSIITGDPRIAWNTLLGWVQEHQSQHTEFVQRVLFPFGSQYMRRWECRTPEMIADDDGSISVEGLVCHWCHQNHATDENDLVMCDGKHCYRAFHFDCVQLSLQEAEEEDDWFCPLCQGLARLLHEVQSFEEGDEWEGKRYARLVEDQSMGSVASWDGVGDALPTAESDYHFAKDFAQGKRTPAIQQWLSDIIGMTYDVDEDEDDDSFDSLSEDDDAESHDMDGEIQVSKDEVAALSGVSEDDSSDSSQISRRRSRRSSARSVETSSDIGKLDMANIVEGRRSRSQVDYLQLNDTLFGSRIDNAEEEEDFVGKDGSGNSSDSSNDGDSGSSSDDESRSSNQGGSSGSDQEDVSSQSPSTFMKKSTRKRPTLEPRVVDENQPTTRRRRG